MSDHGLGHGLVGAGSAVRRRIAEDEAALREADEHAFNEWKKDRQMTTRKTAFGGVVTRPTTTDKAQSNVDALGGLLNDLADAIREAQAREQVVSKASEVDPARFPSARGGGAR